MKKCKIHGPAGWLSGHWGFLFTLIGLAVAIAPWLLSVDIIYCLLLTCIGSAISLIGSYEAKAKQFGFQPPFTNDPIGWREAKKSYESQVDAASGDEVHKDSSP